MTSRTARACTVAMILTAGVFAFDGARGRGVTHLVVAASAPPEEIPAAADVLRVCADPNNMPFSSLTENGFENRLAKMAAASIGRRAVFVWKAQRRGFIRTTLKAGRCDVVMGVPSAFDLAKTTRPYYRSSYVWVERGDRGLHLRSLDDPRLHTLAIGIPITGEDYENPPPAQAFAVRGLESQVRGFPVYGDYSQPDPPRGLIDAVANRDVDAAIAWGPLAGYFCARSPVPLRMTAVTPEIDLPFLPFVFDISMGVRRDDTQLFDELDRYVETHGAEIRKLLVEFNVPLSSGGPS